jgi:hypothetical protein
MTDITTVLNDLKHEDDDERALAQLPTLSGRLAFHRKRLWTISQANGATGIKSYKDKYPEARSIQVQATTIAYQSKPAGYDDYLAGMATRWLSSDVAASATNSTDVAALNERFGTSRFNPANHFSKPIGKRTMAKIREAYSARGLPLDSATVKSMSDVRRVAKAAHAAAEAGTKPFGKIGTISGNQLVIGGRSITIGKNGGRDCIRIDINGARLWQRLDMLEAAMALLLDMGPGKDDLLSITSNVVIGELDYSPENPDLVPAATHEIGDLDYSPIPIVAPPAEQAAPLSLSERMIAKRAMQLAAALKADAPSTEPAQPGDPDADPLAF